MTGSHGAAVVGDLIAVTAAAISAIGALHEFQFHEAVGSIAGLMAITYYLYQFCKWVASHWDNDNGD